MKKLERIQPVLWLLLALVFVGQSPLDRATVALEPSVMDSGESSTVPDEPSGDAEFDGLVPSVGIPAGTGDRSVYGFSSRPRNGCRITCVIPDATGPPRLET